MNISKLSWTSILAVLAVATGAAWLVLIENWTPNQAYAGLFALCMALFAATLLIGLAAVGKGHRLEFLAEVFAALKKDFGEVFGSSGRDH